MICCDAVCVTAAKSRSVSYDILRPMPGLIAWLLDVISSVYPSAAAPATISLAMTPSAPARLSGITGWPSPSLKGCMIMRASTSVPPPGAKPMTSRTGFAGNGCAPATGDSSAAHTVTAAAILA